MCDESHEQCPQGGYRQKGSREALQTRLASMDAAEANPIPVGGGDVDTSGTVRGGRKRAPVGGGEGIGYSHPIVG